MNKEELIRAVEKIIAQGHDPEAAHSEEDELHLEVIREFCPDWVIEEINRLDNAPFARWCA